MVPVQNVIKNSKLSKTEIDCIVLVGGSPRILKIQKLVGDFFNSKELRKFLTLMKLLPMVQQFKQPF
jgi:L1 cell adhesion molecule like protein